MSQYDDEIMKRAKSVWQTMHSEAYKRGMAVQRDKTYGDGRVIINTVGAFIKGLSKERGWDLDQNKVDLVRRYLKATGNVVVLTKVEQYKFRIFIREQWHEGLLVTEPVTKENPSRADKISPHDAGEDRPPAPVKYKCGFEGCGATYDTQNALNAHKGSHKEGEPKPVSESAGGATLDDDEYIVSEQQAAVLLTLKEMGGRVNHEHGRVSSILQQATGLSMSTLSNTGRSLHERGYIDREVRGKRTYRMWMTKKGKGVLTDLNRYRASNYVVADFLAEKGAFTAPKGKLYESLGEQIGLSADRTLSGVHRLVSDGMVEILRESDNSYPHGLIWNGAITSKEDTDEVVWDEPEEQAAPESETVSVDVPQKAKWLSDEALVTLLKERLAKPKADPQIAKDLEDATEKIDLIRQVITEVNTGSLTPLKALGDIEATLNL